jgi:hypothetical protein
MRSLFVILGCLTVATTCPAQRPGWREIKPTTPPSARYRHAMAYDSARQRTVLFGGQTATATMFRDTWEWDGKNWHRIRPANSPAARQGHTMAYDSSRRHALLFGGHDGVNLLADTWNWDGKTWTQIKPTRSPPARNSHAMAYDSVRRRTVLFGGYPGSGRFLADTWEWDGTNWTRIKPAASPPGRYFHTMVYDSARRRTVLFGGTTDSTNNKKVLGDTWEWDGRNWTQLSPTSSPSARMGHAMAYDSARQRTVLFGGQDAKATGTRDTWEWNGGNWAKVVPTTSPSARVLPAMVHDSVRQRAILFSGLWSRDTWEYGVPTLTLTANTSTISIANGGTQTLSINAGVDRKNNTYWVFGSATSTMPGVVLTGIHIPLRPDVYTDIAIAAVNGKEFKDFKRTLSATGTATASLNVPAKLPIPVGFKLYHSYIVYHGTSGQIFTSSNPVSVEFK